MAGYFIVFFKKTSKMMSLFFFLTMVLAGALDCYRLLLPSLNTNRLYSAEEIELADWVRNNTDPHSIWMTGSNHNNFLFNLTGRQPLVTYEGWLWSHGYDYRSVWTDLAFAYANPRNKSVLAKYNVDYILVGPNENTRWGADVGTLMQMYPLVKMTNEYWIFSVKENVVSPIEREKGIRQRLFF
jgi:hypothetical protein